MRRVNEAVREVLSAAVAERMKDPRIGFVTVTGAKVSSDLRHAKVYVSVLGPLSGKEATLAALRHSHGYLQGILNTELHLKRTPELEFVYDASIDEGMKIHTMLRAQERALGIDLDAQQEPESADSVLDESECEEGGESVHCEQEE